MKAKDYTGLYGEGVAADYLSQLGHKILEKRWRTATGELDLITMDERTLVGVEVKTRRGMHFGHPFEAVNPLKLQRLHRLIIEYRRQQELYKFPHRIDVIAVHVSDVDKASVEHLKDVTL